MSNLPNKHWQDAQNNFQKVFGNTTVSCTDDGLEISIDLSSKRRFSQSALLAETLTKERISFFVSAGDKKLLTSENEFGVVKFTIPYLNNNGFSLKGLSVLMLKDADVRFNQNRYGETTRRIMSHDPEHILEENTGVPWDKVEGSPYGVTILEPAITQKVQPSVRRNQEFGVGESLLHDSQLVVEINDWINEQTRIENIHGLAPRTAIPIDWATPAKLSRAHTADLTLKKSLRAVFQK